MCDASFKFYSTVSNNPWRNALFYALHNALLFYFDKMLSMISCSFSASKDMYHAADTTTDFAIIHIRLRIDSRVVTVTECWHHQATDAATGIIIVLCRIMSKQRSHHGGKSSAVEDTR